MYSNEQKLQWRLKNTVCYSPKWFELECTELDYKLQRLRLSLLRLLHKPTATGMLSIYPQFMNADFAHTYVYYFVERDQRKIYCITGRNVDFSSIEANAE